MKCLVFCLLLCGCSRQVKSFNVPFVWGHSEETILAQTNHHRQNHHLPPLVVNEKLSRAALLHAQHMAEMNRLSHTLPVDGARNLTDRLAAFNYDWSGVAENIAWNNSYDGVVNDWMSSSGHRRNILGDYTEMGVGISVNDRAQPYFCLVLGKTDGNFKCLTKISTAH